VPGECGRRRCRHRRVSPFSSFILKQRTNALKASSCRHGSSRPLSSFPSVRSASALPGEHQDGKSFFAQPALPFSFLYLLHTTFSPGMITRQYFRSRCIRNFPFSSASEVFIPFARVRPVLAANGLPGDLISTDADPFFLLLLEVRLDLWTVLDRWHLPFRGSVALKKRRHPFLLFAVGVMVRPTVLRPSQN